MRLFVLLALVLAAATPAWAQPSIAATNTTSVSVANTSHAINMPASISAGDLLMVIFALRDATNTITWPGDWTMLCGEEQADASSRTRVEVGYKTAGGSDSLTITSSGLDESASIAYRITGHHASTAPECATASQATTVNPDPPALNPTNWGTENSLWIAGAVWSGSPTGSAYPTNYDSNQLEVDSGGGTNANVKAATRTASTASEDPGTFSISASTNVSAVTLGIRPAAATGGRISGGGLCSSGVCD
jgi:hypothetical protein